MTTAARLLAAVRAVVPAVVDVSIGTEGNSATVTVHPENQQAAAQATINAFDWSQAAQDAWDLQQSRSMSSTQFTGDPNMKIIRALGAVLVDELNLLREWITAFQAAVAAATSLADLKTRVAGLPSMPDRTLAQAKNAVQNRINDGTTD